MIFIKIVDYFQYKSFILKIFIAEKINSFYAKNIKLLIFNVGLNFHSLDIKFRFEITKLHTKIKTVYQDEAKTSI